jgi:hypothetical protein
VRPARPTPANPPAAHGGDGYGGDGYSGDGYSGSGNYGGGYDRTDGYRAIYNGGYSGGGYGGRGYDASGYAGDNGYAAPAPASPPASAPGDGYGGGNGRAYTNVSRILSGADYQAAAVTQQASYQAAMINRQVVHEAAEIREAARLEAAELIQQASLQATALREEAEIAAAEMRNAVSLVQTEFNEFAARVTGTFPNQVLSAPVTGPLTRPHPPAGPQARPRPAPAERTPGKHGPRPARSPAAGGQGRQVTAMKIAVAATAVLVGISVLAGAAEIKLHGFDFFVFRATGVGETGSAGLNEDQGPGQPNAPKPSPSHVLPSTQTTTGTHKG